MSTQKNKLYYISNLPKSGYKRKAILRVLLIDTLLIKEYTIDVFD